MCRRGRCRGWVSRADRRRHWTPRTGPRRGGSTRACRWPGCSRQPPRLHRAAPGCRGGRRGPRRTTSLVRSAGATSGPAATRPVGLDPHAGDNAVAMGSAKAGPVGAGSAAAGGGCGKRCRSAGSRGAQRDRWRAAGGGAGGAGSSSAAWARSRSSGVFDQRHAKSEPAPPEMPLVRRSANAPQASRMVATMVARRSPSERRRPATAHTTKARHSTGIA